MESKSGQNQMGMLMSVNQITYAPPVDGSLVNDRQYKEYNFQPLSYTGLVGAPQMLMNSGDDFVYGPTSYLRMKLASSTATTTFASTAMDLFNEFQLQHRSGDLIDRTQNVNALVAELIKYQEGKGYHSGYTQVMGQGATNANINAGIDVIIPLSWFSGVFSQKALIPSSLLAGSKLTLQWERIAKAVIDSGGSDPVLTITGLSLVLDSFELMDSARKALLQQMANVKTQGLQYSYSSWVNVNKNFTSTGFDFDVNLSAAKAELVLVKTRKTADFALDKNSILSEQEYPYSDWRLRLGSEVQPQHQVRSVAEAYVITQNSWGNYHCDDLNTRKPAHVEVGYAAYSAANGRPSVAIELSKNQVLANSGRPTNNSRLINFNGTFAGAVDRQMDVWVQILKVANVMVDNVVVDK